MRPDGKTISRGHWLLHEVHKLAVLPIFLAAFARAGLVAEQWHPVDISLTSTTAHSNPFDVTLSGQFTGPGNTILTVPGFCDGTGSYKIRFAPTKVGTWTYSTTSDDPLLNGLQGSVSCVANTLPTVHGRLGIDPQHPRHFLYEDGSRYFLNGFEIDWLGLMDFGDTTVPKAKSIIDMYSAQGFNQVIMNAYAWDTNWEPGITGPYDFGPPKVFIAGGTNAAPDWTRLNPAFFLNYDHVMDALMKSGVVAHIFLFVNNKKVNWPVENSANETRYIKYLVSRYQAYPNVSWDLDKEAYSYTGTNPQAWFHGRLALIDSTDAYHRLRTMHDSYNPGHGLGNVDYNLSANSLLDYYTDQDHANYYSDAVKLGNAANDPYYNAEHSYQIGNDGGHTYSSINTKLQCLLNTYEIAMAGGYAAYYYTYHAWDVVRYAEVPASLNMYAFYTNFFLSTNWFTLKPSDASIGSPSNGHCLANPGVEYIVYSSDGKPVSLTISGASGALHGSWMNIQTGAKTDAGTFSNGKATLSPPGAQPSVIWLHSGTAGVVSPPRVEAPSDIARQVRVRDPAGRLLATFESRTDDPGLLLSKARGIQGLRSGVYRLEWTSEGEPTQGLLVGIVR